MRFMTIATAVVLAWPVTVRADAPAAKRLGDPGILQSLAIESGRLKDGSFVLAGRDTWQQLLVTGRYAGGQVRDLTSSVTYDATPDGIVAIDETGLVRPLKDGEATIR